MSVSLFDTTVQLYNTSAVLVCKNGNGREGPSDGFLFFLLPLSPAFACGMKEPFKIVISVIRKIAKQEGGRRISR